MSGDEDGEHTENGKLLFFKSGSKPEVPSLHFEIPNLKWQFSHGGPLEGRTGGLVGTLTYNDGYFDGSLSKDKPTEADFYAEQEPGGRNALVKFYAPNSDKLIGRLKAADPNSEAASSDLLDERKKGKWEFVGGESLFAKLDKKYGGRKQLADGLFLNSTATSKVASFRLEVYRLFWEFYDGPDIGHRLKGTLFHNDGFFSDTGENKLPTTQPTNADYYIDQLPGGKGFDYVHIKLYAPGKGNEKLLGEFLAEDPHKRVDGFDFLRKRKEGAWNKVNYPTSGAIVKKAADKTVAELKAGPVGKKTDIDFKGIEGFSQLVLNVEGQFIYKSLSKLGNVVRWYEDRAVFYESGKSDFTAFFIPADDKKLGSDVKSELKVFWTDIKS